MSFLIEYEREIGHPDAEFQAVCNRLQPLRRRIGRRGMMIRQTSEVV